METPKDSNTSDRDRKMMGAFENFGDKDKSSEKKSKKEKSKKAPLPLFERALDEEPPKDIKPPKGILEIFAEKPEEKSNENEPKDIENLEPEETAQAVLEYTEVREADIASNPDEDPDVIAADEADRNFLSRLRHMVEEGRPAEEAITEAYDDAAVELGNENPEDTPTDDKGVESDYETETPAGVESQDDDVEDDPLTPLAQNTPTPTPVAPPVIPRPVQNTPPTPIIPSGGGANFPPPPNANTLGGGFNQPPVAPNVSPGINPNVGVVSPNVVRSRNRAGDLLLGGFVGYLIGRRRGRIKTEARLEPIQKNLEMQVKDLSDNIYQKESDIRKLAVEKNRAVTQRAASERIATDQEARPVETKAESPTLKPEKSESNLFEVPAAQSKANRETATAVNSEPKLEAKIERKPEQMSETELIEVARNIKTETGTAEQLYQNGRLTKEGLRRVVGEYMKGGKVEMVLAAEIIGEEKVRERALEQDKGDDPRTGSGIGANTDSEERMYKIGSLLPTFNEQVSKPMSTNSSSDQVMEAANVAQSNQNEAIQSKRPSMALVVIVGVVIAISIIALLV